MPAAKKYPNYSEDPNSPELDKPGVAIRLPPPEDGRTYRADEPIILNGKCGANRDLNQRAQNYPLTRVEVQIGAQKPEPEKGKAPKPEKEEEKEQPLARRPVQEAHVLPQGGEPAAGGADYTVFSYFNLDLAASFKVLKEPGKYWVMAEFFDMKTEKILFEVKK